MGKDSQAKNLIPDGGNVFYTEYYDKTPVVAIAHGLSEIEDNPVTEIPALYDYVDPDAINRLMEIAHESNQDVTVHVSIEDYEISVDSDGTISLRDSELDTGSSTTE